MFGLISSIQTANSNQNSTPYLASDAVFGVETPDGAIRLKVAPRPLLLSTQPLNRTNRVAAQCGPLLALMHDRIGKGRSSRKFQDDSSSGREREMTTRITQIEEQTAGSAVLKVEGSLTLEDAKLLEKVCSDLQEQHGCDVRINLAGLSFLDEKSASLLCRLKKTPGVELEGAHLFVWQLIERAERNGNE
jgi:anti-anti-sigma regulatory factor